MSNKKTYIKGLSTYDSDEELFSVTIGDTTKSGLPKDKLFIAFGKSEKEAGDRATLLIELLETKKL